MPKNQGSAPPVEGDDPIISEDHSLLRKIEANYPHKIHPGLVPGISVDDQRIE